MPKSLFKQEVQQKVPKRYHSQAHFLALLELVSQHNIESKEHLHHFLEQQAFLVEKEVGEYAKKGNLSGKIVREKVMHLEALKKCHGLAKEFL
ncbi:hypothetical protein HZC30_05760 [Candidatus Woesearchaeota archaeon]|nr:hypothetical protein [Candidatus Woesearchaeota archaeon]